MSTETALVKLALVQELERQQMRIADTYKSNVQLSEVHRELYTMLENILAAFPA